MSFLGVARYALMRDIGAPALFRIMEGRKKRERQIPSYFGPPMDSLSELKRIMMRHYYLARYAEGVKPIAWVTSGAPVELLRVFDFYTIYPENHGALCGARRKGPELCEEAESRGYDQDLCSYARVDLGVAFSGKTPVGRLPKPDLLFASNNICQTVAYWYKVLAHHWKIPLIVFDTPYNFDEISERNIDYMIRQMKEMVPLLERVSGKKYDEGKFKDILLLAKEASLLWGEVLSTMRNKPAPMTIFEAFGHLAPIVSLRGLPVAIQYYQSLLKELKDRVDRGIGAIAQERKRLMWDNIAIWFKVKDFSHLFAQRGMNFVTATYTNAWAETTPYMDESHPLESMAKAYSLVILNNNLNHRLRLMERLIGEYEVDGLVVHSARSCKPYSVGQYDLKRLLLDRVSVPSVVIEADITDFRAYSEEQANTRLEAFFESLEARQ